MRSNSPYPVRSSPYPYRHSPYHHARSPPFPRGTSPLPRISPYTVTNASFPRNARSSVSPHTVIHEAPIESSGDVSGEHSVSSSQDESQPLLSPGFTSVVYARRWYLLLLFSMMALLQTLIWATWGPISQSAEAAFSWDDADVTMCVWMGNASFALLCIPLSWLMDHRGLRISVLLSCLFIALGAGLRCLIDVVPSSYILWCVYGGQLLNGMAGPVAQGGAALFSTLWFPNNQRATSTAISTFVGYMGSALAFVLGPTLVSSPSDIPPNGTIPSGNTSYPTGLFRDNNTVITDYLDQRNGIINYLYYQAIAAAVLLVLVLAYFPDKPPHPPSLSAAVEREEFRQGLSLLVRNKQFWLISGAFCLSFGVFEVWDVVLDVNLSYIGITQEEAGWLGFYCVVAGCLTGLIICRMADIFFKQIRLFLILSYLVSGAFILWFILIYINILPFDMPSIYAAVILSGVFLDGCSPLVYELVCEAAYPVGEGVSSCFLQMLFVLVGMAFTSVQEIPNIGTEWMNWCLFGTICIAIPMLWCVKDVSGRADIDAFEDQVVVVKPPDNYSTQREGSKGITDSKTSGINPSSNYGSTSHASKTSQTSSNGTNPHYSQVNETLMKGTNPSDSETGQALMNGTSSHNSEINQNYLPSALLDTDSHSQAATISLLNGSILERGSNSRRSRASPDRHNGDSSSSPLIFRC